MEDNSKRIGYCGWDVLYLFVQKIFSLPALLAIIIIIGSIRIPEEDVGIYIKDSIGFLANNILIVILVSIILILLIFIFALWKIKNAEINRVASERNFYQKKSGVDIESSGGLK